MGGQHTVMACHVFCILNDWGDLSLVINHSISLTNLSGAAFSTSFQMGPFKLCCLLGRLILMHLLELSGIIPLPFFP